MISKEVFNGIADQMINDYFVNFKEKYIFLRVTETQVYDPESGSYVNDTEEVIVEAIPTSISRDLLNSGIYTTADIQAIFEFQAIPDFVDIGTKIIKDGKAYTVAEYIPDVSSSIVKILFKR